MTKDEIFNEFSFSFQGRASIGGVSQILREEFNRCIAPYLAIPRSLEDDPPIFKQTLLRLKLDKYGYVYEVKCGGCSEDVALGWTHWIPIENLTIDKDEQEFEEWEKANNPEQYAIPGNTFTIERRKSWMAARGRK
jgi:hypothetical protein